jgi:methyl-accepting chemotaxis protein
VIAAVVAETGDVAKTFSATAGAVDEIHQMQINIASSVEEQAAVPASVTEQLSNATLRPIRCWPARIGSRR